MSFWVVTYHIDFHMDDGKLITRNDVRTIEDSNIDSEAKVKAWLFDLYESSDDPMVDMRNLFVGIESEELVIDEIIFNDDPFSD